MSKELKTFKVVFGNHTEFADALTAQEAVETTLRDYGIEPVGIPIIRGDYVLVFIYENVMVTAEVITVNFPTEPEGLTPEFIEKFYELEQRASEVLGLTPPYIEGEKYWEKEGEWL